MNKSKYKKIVKEECPHLYQMCKCYFKSEIRRASCLKDDKNLSCCFFCEDECSTNCIEKNFLDLMIKRGDKNENISDRPR